MYHRPDWVRAEFRQPDFCPAPACSDEAVHHVAFLFATLALFEALTTAPFIEETPDVHVNCPCRAGHDITALRRPLPS